MTTPTEIRQQLESMLPGLRAEAHRKHQAECRSFISRDRISVTITATLDDGTVLTVAS